MSHDRVSYEEVEPVAEGMHFLRDPLNCEQLGLTVVEVGPDWTGKEHDHSGDGQEEIYLLLDGAATLTVEGEAMELSPGEAVRVDPDATRQLEITEESRMVIAGAD